MLSAYGDSFSGDFLVTSKSDDVLELVLVDVSGKGIAAGTRSLLLSGRLRRPARVDARTTSSCRRPTPTCCARHWDEGFATAAHAMINLTTGEYSLGSAGHPPGRAVLGRLGPVGGPRG